MRMFGEYELSSRSSSDKVKSVAVNILLVTGPFALLLMYRVRSALL